MAEMAVAGPLRVGDLANQLGADPDGVPGVGAGEWGRERAGPLVVAAPGGWRDGRALAGLLADTGRTPNATAAVVMTGGNCDRDLVRRVVASS
jgi:hypothetical protein